MSEDEKTPGASRKKEEVIEFERQEDHFYKTNKRGHRVIKNKY